MAFFGAPNRPNRSYRRVAGAIYYKINTFVYHYHELLLDGRNQNTVIEYIIKLFP